jgi:hypothetical protein
MKPVLERKGQRVKKALKAAAKAQAASQAE